MALFEIVVRSVYKNQVQINRWNYLGSGTPVSIQMSFALAQAFGGAPVAGAFPATTVLNAIQNIVHVDTSFEEIQVRDVYSVTDFFAAPFIPKPAGGVAGEGLSPFVTVGFRTNRVRTDIARGTKRVGGISEASIGDGGEVSGGYLTNVIAVATAMSETLEYVDGANTLTFIPVVVGKEMYTTPPDPKAYRYYETFAEQDDHIASGVTWEPYTQVRSQTSRQYGRGI